MSGTEMVVQEAQQMDRPATALEIRKQVNLVQEVMQAVMKENVHYGKVPGCGDKPTLLKAGAEKLLSTFRIAVTPDIEDLSTSDKIHYRVKAVGATPNGIHVGTGVGECSSHEEKFMWRYAVCDKEYEETDESRRRMKYKRDGSSIKQVRVNAADMANTVLKMAKKRAVVDLTLTATAASDCFSQDLEELPEEYLHKPQQKPIQQPQRKASSQSQHSAPSETLKNVNAPIADSEDLALDESEVPEEDSERYGIQDVKEKTGTSAKGPWSLFIVATDKGEFLTFDKKIGALATQLCGGYAHIEWKAGRKVGSKDIVSLSKA